MCHRTASDPLGSLGTVYTCDSAQECYVFLVWASFYISVCVQNIFGHLHREFENSEGCIKRPCLKTENQVDKQLASFSNLYNERTLASPDPPPPFFFYYVVIT